MSLADQDRWNSYSKEFQTKLERARKVKKPNLRSPFEAYPWYQEFYRRISPVKDRSILEVGSGRGLLSCFLAKQGACITGVDLGPDLVAVAQGLANLHQLDSAKFRIGNATALPVDNESQDIVYGIMILHHLSSSDLVAAVQEAHRVLKKGGRAFFYEPIENSKAFNFLQNLIPSGKKGEKFYRPSILNQAAWRTYLQQLDDRTLTHEELRAAGESFERTRFQEFGFLIRFRSLLGPKSRDPLLQIDEKIFRLLPALRPLAQTVLVEFTKS